MLLLVSLGVLAATATGCSRSYTLERELANLAAQFLNAFYARDYNTASSYLTGQALASMRSAVPPLAAANVQNKISGFDVKCDYVSRDKMRGDVVAKYVFEQTVPGAGTTAVDMTTVFKFIKIAGQWKIYSFATAVRTPKK